MDFEDPFKGCWDRYDRAIVHREEAAKVWADFLDHDDAYSISLYMEPEREGVGRGTVVVRQYEPIPSLLSILMGEYFYNLRAALDYAVYATAVIDNGWHDPPPRERDLQFPVCDTPESWRANAFHVAPLSERHRSWIEQVQPYQGAEDPKVRGIYWLNHLARLDRHRELRVVGGYVVESNPLVRVKPPAVVAFERMPEEIFVEDDTVIARFTVSPWAEGDEVQANPNTSIDVELKDFAVGRPREATWLYERMDKRLWIMETVIHSEVGRLEYDCVGHTRAKYFDTNWAGFKKPGVVQILDGST
jgi:hypothetical protein